MPRITNVAPLAIALALICCLAGAYVLRDAGIDDVGISYRYALHFAEGHGLTWNVGEEPVEGYSNLSWVLILAVCHLVGADIEIASRFLALLFGLAALLLAGRLADSVTESVDGEKANAWTVPVLVALSPTWLMWMMSGLEIALYGLLLVASVYASTMKGRNGTILMAVSLALLLLTRPEGIVLASVFLGVVWILSRKSEDSQSPRLFPALLAVVGSAAAVTIFRITYYGYPLPNTVYAKFSTLFPSVEAVGQWVLFASPFLLLWILTARRWWNSKARVPMATAIILILVQTVQILPVNPVMHFLHRYTIAFLPLLLLPVPLTLSYLAKRRQSFVWGLAVVAGLWIVHEWPAVLRYYDANAFMKRRQQCVIENLQKLPPDTRIAMIDAGRIPFRTDLPAIDIWGLCDRRIGHEGFSASFILNHPSGSPDAIIMALRPVATGYELPFGTDRMILGDITFSSHYKLWTVCSADPGERPEKPNSYWYLDYGIYLKNELAERK